MTDGEEVDMTAGAPPTIEIDLDWCKACGICIGICPRKILAEAVDGSPEVIDAQRCTRCLLCELICPDFAIRVSREE